VRSLRDRVTACLVAGVSSRQPTVRVAVLQPGVRRRTPRTEARSGDARSARRADRRSRPAWCVIVNGPKALGADPTISYAGELAALART
jgi:hypothetical protein